MSSVENYLDESERDGLEPMYEEESSPGVEQSGGSRFDWTFLKSPTGEGSIEEYTEHVLNFNGSKGMARIIRGLSGMFGNLNYAVVDIVCGVLELLKGRAKANV